jgi:CheY-like chemotaxis protein
VAKVFEEFGQVNASVWRRGDGSGLGIPISQRFVNLHGGRLWLTSEVGSGTTFSFTLPLPGMEEGLPAADGRGDEQMWQANVRRSAPRLVVLLARDPSVGDVLASYLEGYRLIAATAAATALQQVARLLPQALLLDAALAEEPETDRLLQALPYDLPVLVLTLPGQSTHVNALPPGVTDYLVKPVLRDALSGALDRLGRPIHRLLLIDDDPDMARYITLALAVRGAGAPLPELLTASCGSDALALLDSLERRNEELPDAIMLDLGLPDMSGWAVLAALQATPAFRDLPVILITAASLPEELDSRQRRTLQVSTRRPLTADELSATLSGILAAIRPRVPAGADASMPTEDFFE